MRRAELISLQREQLIDQMKGVRKTLAAQENKMRECVERMKITGVRGAIGGASDHTCDMCCHYDCDEPKGVRQRGGQGLTRVSWKCIGPHGCEVK